MRINIHYKITLIFTIILAFVSFGIYFHLNQNLQKHTYQRIRGNLHRQISLLQSYLEEDSLQNIHPYKLDNIADKFGRSLGLRVTLINLQGVVLGDSELDGEALRRIENHLQRPEVGEALKNKIGESRRFSTTIKRDMLYVATLYGKKKPKGIIRLAMPLSEIELISNQLKKTVGASIGIAFILAIITTFLASAFISKPLRSISAVTQDMAQGIFTQKVVAPSNDEIGDLAKAFNYMSGEIKTKLQELNISRSRLEAVFLSMIEGVMVFDSEGKIILMNNTLKDFFLIKGDPIGKKPIEVIRNIEIQDTIDSALINSSKLKTCEVALLGSREKVLSINATPVIRDGQTEGAVLVFHDITTFRQLESMRRDFVANVSHELRTPVSTIKGYAETLIDGALEDKENAKDFIEIILSDSNRLAALIDDLLDLSRIESNKLDIELKPIPLKSIVDRVTSGLRKYAEDKGVDINIEIPADLPNILADEDRIAQVLLNLENNAVKYNHTNGIVTISAKEIDNLIQVDISDDGIGIPKEALPRLFERFYRVDKARSRELGGTGLGLSIVKHIVSAHNGEVSVTSELGTGSTFTFTIQKG